MLPIAGTFVREAMHQQYNGSPAARRARGARAGERPVAQRLRALRPQTAR